jgi:hypothetical protein
LNGLVHSCFQHDLDALRLGDAALVESDSITAFRSLASRLVASWLCRGGIWTDGVVWVPALIQGPSVYHPKHHPEFVQQFFIETGETHKN